MEQLEKYISMCRLAVRQYFARLDKHEEEALKAWLKEKETNQELYDSIEEIGTSGLEHYYRRHDVEGQLDRFYRNRMRSARFWLLRWAVMVILLVMVGGTLLYLEDKEPPQTTLAATGMPEGVCLVLSDGRQVSLTGDDATRDMTVDRAVVEPGKKTLTYETSDTSREQEYNTLIVPKGTSYHLVLCEGTRVWLNADSKITYPVSFPAGTREVRLEGEAYFDVSRNEVAPFTVKTDGMDVRVLGTEFIVNTFADDGYVSAALIKGRVKVYGKKKDARELLPGQMARIGKEGEVRVESTDLKPHVAWMDDVFCFRNTPLSGILKQVERYYNVKVVYPPDYQEEYYTGDIYRNKPLRTLLDVLELTIPVNFEMLDQVIYIKKRI